MILGIVHTALLVRDYEEAKQFYCGILGFRVSRIRPIPTESVGCAWDRRETAYGFIPSGEGVGSREN